MHKSIIIFFCILFSSQATTVFFGTTKGSGIYCSELNLSNGDLSPIHLSYKLNRPSFLTIDKKNRFLYSTNLKNWKDYGEVISFKINNKNILEEINRSSSMGINPCHLSLNSSNILFISNYNSGSVTSYLINPDGYISNPVSHIKHYGHGILTNRQNKPHAHSIFPHPNKNYVYAADLGSDAIFIYKFNRNTAELSLIKKYNIPGGGLGPRHMKWDNKGEYLYVLNELNPSLSIFEYLNNGLIKQIGQIDVLPVDMDRLNLTAAEIKFHPHKSIIYVSIRDKNNFNRDSISIFKAEGRNTYRIKTISSIVSFPRNFNIDPSGKWMIIAGQRSENLAVFSLDKNGLPNLKETYLFPGEPVCVEFVD